MFVLSIRGLNDLIFEAEHFILHYKATLLNAKLSPYGVKRSGINATILRYNLKYSI